MAMYKAGIPISYIKDFLRHSSLDSTVAYTHADNEAMAETLRFVDQEVLPEKDDNADLIDANVISKYYYCSAWNLTDLRGSGLRLPITFFRR